MNNIEIESLSFSITYAIGITVYCYHLYKEDRKEVMLSTTHTKDRNLTESQEEILESLLDCLETLSKQALNKEKASYLYNSARESCNNMKNQYASNNLELFMRCKDLIMYYYSMEDFKGKLPA